MDMPYTYGMSTFLYRAAKVALLSAGLDLTSADVRAIPVTAAYTPAQDADDYLDDVPGGARAATAVALTTEAVGTATGVATFDADDVTFPAVAAGDPITGVVLYIHTGTESTSLLLGYFDNLSNLPLTPDGRNVTVTWPADRIFKF